MKLGQNVCLNDILDKFENASHQLDEILKNCVYAPEATFSVQYSC